MKEGESLRLFIENQPKSKISIARDLNISKQTLFQYFKSKELTKEIKDRFESYFGKKIFGRVSMTTDQQESSNVVEEPEVDYSQPIIQVVLNLSYTSKKNADSMDKMAATNQKNTEIIAALVGAILPNSKLANQLTSTLADLYKDDDRPVEDFLPKGTDLSSPIKEKQKAVTK